MELGAGLPGSGSLGFREEMVDVFYNRNEIVEARGDA
jgi:hypothetical protein